MIGYQEGKVHSFALTLNDEVVIGGTAQVVSPHGHPNWPLD